MRFTKARSCRGKMRFKSRQEALKSIRYRELTDAKAYRCQHCGSWHVGHRTSYYERS